MVSDIGTWPAETGLDRRIPCNRGSLWLSGRGRMRWQAGLTEGSRAEAQAVVITTGPGQRTPGDTAVTTQREPSEILYGTVKRTVVWPSLDAEGAADDARLALLVDQQQDVVRPAARLLRQAVDRQVHRPVAVRVGGADAERGERVLLALQADDANGGERVAVRPVRRAGSRRRSTPPRSRRPRRGRPATAAVAGAERGRRQARPRAPARPPVRARRRRRSPPR